MGTHQRAAVVEGVQADDERVRTQHRLAGGQVGALLAESQRHDPPLVDDQLVADDGGARGMEPGSSPVVHVAARDLREHLQEVLQSGVTVGPALEEPA